MKIDPFRLNEATQRCFSRLRNTGRASLVWLKRFCGPVRQKLAVNSLVFLGIFLILIAISTLIVFRFHQSLPRDPQLVATVNEQNNRYAGIGLIFDNLDLSTKTVRLRPSYQMSPQVQGAIMNSQQDLSVRLWTASPKETSPELPLRAEGSEAYITITATPAFGEPIPERSAPPIVLDGPLSGETAMFPFDTYRLVLGATMHTNKTQDPVAFAFFIYKNLDYYDIKTGTNPDNSIVIALCRNNLSRAVILLPIFVLYLISALVGFMLIKGRKVSVDIGTTMPILALLVAIPSMRIAAVPSQIAGWTLLDVALLVPTVVLIAATIRLIYSHVRQ